MNDDKRLIEDYLPIQAISKEASREKSVRKGHISTLHLWWARRPLVACRAAVYGALVPASRYVPHDASAKAVKKGRENSERFVAALCQYPSDAGTIAEAEQHILEAHSTRLSEELGKKVTVADIRNGDAPRPRVLDMFAGGGAIPLEALRLGCEAYANDLNPVAHIIQLGTLLYPQRFGNADKSERGMVGSKNKKGEATWGGLAEEVRYWGNWVLGRVRTNIGDFYPLIPDPKAKSREIILDSKPGLFPDADRQERLKVAGKYLRPVAYLWTRTVRCINPSCGASVPLVKQTWLCKKPGRFVAMRIVAPKGGQQVRFEVVEAKTETGLGFDPAAFSKGGNAACAFCGTVANIDYVKNEGWESRLGYQMMVVVCAKDGERGKTYLSGDKVSTLMPGEKALHQRIQALCNKTNLTVPEEPIANLPAENRSNSLGITVRPYGIRSFGDLFTPRQLLCLLSFAAVIHEAEGEMRQSYGAEQTKAVSTYLGFVLDRLADWNSSLCSWSPESTGGAKIGHTFGRQVITMVWDFAESGVWGSATGSADLCLDWVVKGINEAILDKNSLVPIVHRGSATKLPWGDSSFDAVVTDPPYYDNIPYADIADFFYVWLKRTVGHLYPEHFSTQNTPKKNEAIADAGRHGGDKERANKAYETMMAQAFSEAHRVLKPGGQMTVVYAHKTTLGWSTLVDALRHAGFTVTEAWPLDTEMKARLRGMESAALASSIFLVARKRDGAQTGAYETDVRPALERIVRERVETLWSMGISGADLVIAAVGAGLRAFTRFAHVEFANGEEVPAERFLTEVEGVVLETLLDKIFGFSRSGVAAVDGPSRFYVLWRYAYKAAELDAGEAIVFAYPQSVELDGPHGLTQGKAALVEKKKSKYRLRDFSERGAREDLGFRDEESTNGATPSLIDVLHRILWLMENQPRNLNGYLDQARPDRERLRQVAQALAGPALKGGEVDAMLINTTPAEAGALGKLLANWRTLIDARLEEFELR
jgi:putative DNA methylase